MMIDIQTYRENLRRHDWFFYMSDDHRVWSTGDERSKEMLGIAVNGTDEHRRAYNECHALHFNTSAFVTPNRPYKPPFTV